MLNDIAMLTPIMHHAYQPIDISRNLWYTIYMVGEVRPIQYMVVDNNYALCIIKVLTNVYCYGKM
jgi:hypothetical protein